LQISRAWVLQLTEDKGSDRQQRMSTQQAHYFEVTSDDMDETKALLGDAAYPSLPETLDQILERPTRLPLRLVYLKHVRMLRFMISVHGFLLYTNVLAVVN
jgi:hypothetical protein